MPTNVLAKDMQLRVFSPIGLGVELEQVFGSKWLLDQLHSLGFSISYDEASLSEPIREMEVPHSISIRLVFSVEYCLADTGLHELVWLYVGCFPFGCQLLIYRYERQRLKLPLLSDLFRGLRDPQQGVAWNVSYFLLAVACESS